MSMKSLLNTEDQKTKKRRKNKMLPFKTLFFYPLSTTIELVIVVDKNGNVKQKVCSSKLISSKILDRLERVFEEAN